MRGKGKKKYDKGVKQKEWKRKDEESQLLTCSSGKKRMNKKEDGLMDGLMGG